MNDRLIKREGASGLILTILIWSVLSVLITRMYLRLMNNPMIAFGQWHIAHVLFGGIIMFLGMAAVMVFEGKNSRKNGAIIFGIGWGLFIDEIGKYLTMDNDYWFKPAIMIIYISFILLFMLYRYLERSQNKDNLTSFYAILDNVGLAAENGIDENEKAALAKKVRQLARTKNNHVISTMALGILNSIKSIKTIERTEKETLGILVNKVFSKTYNRFFKRKIVVWGLWIYSVYYALEKIIDVVTITVSKQKLGMIQRFYQDYDFFGKSDIYMIVFKIFFDFLAAILFLIGARYFWSKKRIRGIRYFKYGLYVSIFFSSIFRFYFEQLGGVYEVLMSILILELVNRYRREVELK